MKNLLGKLGIGRVGASTGTGNFVRTGSPEDAYRSGAAEFLRTAQQEGVEETPKNAPNKKAKINPVTEATSAPENVPAAKTAPGAGRMTHPVILVSKFKYPYVRTKSVPGEEGEKSTKVETGELGWKYAANKEFAEQEAQKLYAYKVYHYRDTQNGRELVIGQPIEEYLAGARAKQQNVQHDVHSEENALITQQILEDERREKSRRKSRVETLLQRFAVAGEAGGDELPTNDFSVDREIDTPEQYVPVGTPITRFTTNPKDPNGEAQRLNARVFPAISLGYRAYEVMPNAVAASLYKEPDGQNESAIPTWTKEIDVPTLDKDIQRLDEESRTYSGSNFRYRFPDGQPIPTLNGVRHVLAELLSVNGEKAKKDPGMNADFNVYEYMTANNLWSKMDKTGHLTPSAKAKIGDAEAQIESSPELEHFSLGGGSLINLGGKKDAIMSEENLLALALRYMSLAQDAAKSKSPDLSSFTYINEKGTEAFRPRKPDAPDTRRLTNAENKLHAARRAYVQKYDSLTPSERKADPELAELASAANNAGIEYVKLMATEYPSKLREFVLSHPYVGHAPIGDHGRPGGKHESSYALSPDTHIFDNDKQTVASYESEGGLHKLDSDDRKIYALVKAFDRNAQHALNNHAKTLHSSRHARMVEVPSESGDTYKIPVPKDESGEWTDDAGKSIDFMENHWLRDYLLDQEDKKAIAALQGELASKGHNYSFGQVATAYLKNKDRLKIKKHGEGYGLLTSDEHFMRQGPYTFHVPSNYAKPDNVS